MLDAEPATWAWLIAFGIFSLTALLAIAGQAALEHASRPRLRLLHDAGVTGARRALALLDDHSPAPLLVLVLQVVGLGGAAVSLIAAVTQLADTPPWEIVVSVVGAGSAFLILGVLVRAAALARPEATAVALAGPLRLANGLLYGVVAALRWLEGRALALIGNGRGPDAPASDAELRLLVETVEDTRKLEADEREMIHGIFVMSERPVRDVMVPRIDVVSMPRVSTLGDVLDRIVASGFSRIPIVSDTIDDVVGVVYAKDVLRALRAGALADPAAPIARKPYFVPDTKKVDELLQDLQQKRVHMAVVVDEYGGTAGLVTIEDLLEEIVGEIHDEYDENEELPIVRIDEAVSVVDARVPIRDVNEALDLHLSDDEFDTLGGLVFHELGKVPTEGDEVRVNGCQVTVERTQGRRIRKLRVRLLQEGA